MKDCGEIKSQFDEITKMLDIAIEMKHSSKETKDNGQFMHNKGGCLMLECDMQSKLIQQSLEKEQNEENIIKYVGKYAVFVDGVPCDRSIKEIVLIAYSNKMAKQACKSKFE